LPYREHQILKLLVSVGRQIALQSDQQVICGYRGCDLHHIKIRERRCVAGLRSFDQLNALQRWPATNDEERRGLAGFIRALCELTYRVGMINPLQIADYHPNGWLGSILLVGRHV
jgi:hypothetical protein